MKFYQCIFCKNWIGKVKNINKPTCKAFPKGIPKNIISDKIKHDHKIIGQTGDYIFEEEK